MQLVAFRIAATRLDWPTRLLRWSAVAITLALLGACGSAQVTSNASGGTGTPASVPPSNAVSVSVTPGVTTANVGGVPVTFTLTLVDASRAGVTWQVNGATGGSAGFGTISAAGVYLTPAVLPSPATVTVTAVSVADPTQSASVSVTLVDPGQPPTPPAEVTIGGVPGVSASSGQPYAFTPTARSSTGARLTFAVANRPSWAAFDTASGKLSGTPTANDQGTYSNISISVSDGTVSATLVPFTITVKPGITGIATLSWAPPTVRTDGTPLTNLAGFRIYYGTAAGVYTTSISVPNPGVTTYVVADLPAGRYFFVATAYDATGAESGYSPVATKTIG